jgi:hypothetical protein
MIQNCKEPFSEWSRNSIILDSGGIPCWELGPRPSVGHLITRAILVGIGIPTNIVSSSSDRISV